MMCPNDDTSVNSSLLETDGDEEGPAWDCDLSFELEREPEDEEDMEP